MSRSLRNPWNVLWLAAVFLLPACTTRPEPPRAGPRPLPADSAALLDAAIRQARPAYRTQREAIASGAYRSGVPVRLAAAPAAQSPPAAPVMPPRDSGPAPGSTPTPAAPERRGGAEPDRAPPSAGGVWVVQIGSFPGMDGAITAALDAERAVPGARGVLEVVGTAYRVVLQGWNSEADAEAARSAIRSAFPDARVSRGEGSR
jgi:cell division protein FtsN